MTRTSTTQSHDKQAIKEFLMQLAGELRLQEIALQGKLPPPKLQEGVMRLQAKYDSDLLPEPKLLHFLAIQPEDVVDAELESARYALVTRRRDQMKQVMGVIDLLGEVET